MEERFKKLKEEAEREITRASSFKELEELRIKYLGRKSFLANFSSQISTFEPSQRPLAGRLFNETKVFIESLLKEKKAKLEDFQETWDAEIDLPSCKLKSGRLHPITIVIDSICRIFKEIGFEIQEGLELEDEWYNFEALNIPLTHPSRDVFDTFYLDLPRQGKYRYLLRSHTSPSQIRAMFKRKPPLAVIVPGRVYRPDAQDASHSFMFHQIEGFAVSSDIHFGHLKGSLLYFARKFFSSDINLRFRPHFFPFTEPSAEVDISCVICRGKGCSICKRTGWLEILGCGMIHPRVLRNCDINPSKYQGFAFGMGVERIAMLKFRIDDIRLFFENDLRFLEQFYEI